MGFKIFAHRGLGFGLDENSFSAFEESLRKGFSIEIDVQKTLDGIIIITHDSNLKKLFGLNKLVTETKFSEIKKIDTNQRLITFDRVCDLFNKYKSNKIKIAIHVKDEDQKDILTDLIKIVEDKNLLNCFFFFDLSLKGAKLVKDINPSIKVGISVGEKRYNKTIYLWRDIANFKYFDIVWWDEWKKGLYNRSNFQDIKKKDKTVFAISPELHKAHPRSDDYISVWKELIDFGVDGICTNYPLELRKLYNKITNIN